MKQRHLVIGIPVAVLLLLLIFWPDADEKRKARELTAQAKRAALAADPASGEYREFTGENKKLFAIEGMYSFDELIDRARTGRISLVAELWALRTKCEKGGGAEQQQAMNIEECNLRIENFLRENYPPPQNERLVALFRNYLRYEDGMRRLQISDKLPLAERLELMKKKRREFFSEADAQLIFGYDEARDAAQGALSEFYRSSAGLPADERVRKYYELRQKALGDYNSAYNEQEPAYTRYETELMLRGDEMQRKGSAETETQALRERYFGAEAAKRMAKVDSEVREERQRIAAYESAADKLLRENPSLSEGERKAKLTALRVTMLGEDEAAEYERRMEYEIYLRTNHLK